MEQVKEALKQQPTAPAPSCDPHDPPDPPEILPTSSPL